MARQTLSGRQHKAHSCCIIYLGSNQSHAPKVGEDCQGPLGAVFVEWECMVRGGVYRHTFTVLVNTDRWLPLTALADYIWQRVLLHNYWASYHDTLSLHKCWQDCIEQ